MSAQARRIVGDPVIQSSVTFSYSDPFAPIGAFFPPWLQIILFGYLGIVLMQWAMNKLAERRGFLLFVIYLAAAVFFTIRSVFLLIRLL